MATFATFFSYKGGAGRSTTCLNTLPLLAEVSGAYEYAPILLLDMDIESAGMTYLLGMQNEFKGKFDVKEFIRGEENWPPTAVGSGIVDHPLYKHFRPVGKKLGLGDDMDDAVMFLGVDDSSDALDRSVIDGAIETVLTKFRRFCTNNKVRVVVADSAAGDQFSARLSVDLADKLIFCMRSTIQFRIGTFNYLGRMNLRAGSFGDDTDIILLPTVVPADAEIDGVKQLAAAANDVARKLEGLPNLRIFDDFISEESFGINEIARFKWKEGVLYALQKQDAAALSADEKTALDRYRKLAQLIVD